MFEKLKIFIRTSLLGGFVVILPISIFVLIVKWIYKFVSTLVQPIDTLLFKNSPYIKGVAADVIVILIVLIVCFLIGIFVKTKLGKWIHDSFEKKILRIAPGYTLIKETVLQFVGHKKSPFSRVALIDVYNTGTLMTAFITDEHSDGSFTVFAPTGPNPTTGFIFHLPRDKVKILNVSIESTVRSIISCGAGSSRLIDEYKKNNQV